VEAVAWGGVAASGGGEVGRGEVARTEGASPSEGAWPLGCDAQRRPHQKIEHTQKRTKKNPSAHLVGGGESGGEGDGGGGSVNGGAGPAGGGENGKGGEGGGGGLGDGGDVGQPPGSWPPKMM
jgi:hypothetical protein